MQKNLQLLDKSIKSISCESREIFYYNVTSIKIVFSDGIVAEHEIISKNEIAFDVETLDGLIARYDLSNFTANDFVDEFFQDIDEIISSSAIGGRTC